MFSIINSKITEHWMYVCRGKHLKKTYHRYTFLDRTFFQRLECLPVNIDFFLTKMMSYLCLLFGTPIIKNRDFNFKVF